MNDINSSHLVLSSAEFTPQFGWYFHGAWQKIPQHNLEVLTASYFRNSADADVTAFRPSGQDTVVIVRGAPLNLPLANHAIDGFLAELSGFATAARPLNLPPQYFANARMAYRDAWRIDAGTFVSSAWDHMTDLPTVAKDAAIGLVFGLATAGLSKGIQLAIGSTLMGLSMLSEYPARLNRFRNAWEEQERATTPLNQRFAAQEVATSVMATGSFMGDFIGSLPAMLLGQRAGAGLSPWAPRPRTLPVPVLSPATDGPAIASASLMTGCGEGSSAQAPLLIVGGLALMALAIRGLVAIRSVAMDLVYRNILTRLFKNLPWASDIIAGEPALKAAWGEKGEVSFTTVNNAVRAINTFLLDEPPLARFHELAKGIDALADELGRQWVMRFMAAIPGVSRLVFQVYTREFLDAMAGHLQLMIRDFRTRNGGKNPVIVEIAAGDGRLARSLNRRLSETPEFSGVRIMATDQPSAEWGRIDFGKEIVPLDGVDAAHKGDILIGSWWPSSEMHTFDTDILGVMRQYPLKTLLLIHTRNGSSSSTNTPAFWREVDADFTMTQPKSLNRRVDGKPLTTSYEQLKYGEEHSRVSVITAKKKKK